MRNSFIKEYNSLLKCTLPWIQQENVDIVCQNMPGNDHNQYELTIIIYSILLHLLELCSIGVKSSDDPQ